MPTFPTDDCWQKVGDLKDFNAFMSQMKRHMEEMGISEEPEEEMCRYSPVHKPHPPKVYADGSYCDGNGYIYTADGKSVYPTRCGCYLRAKTRDHVAEYLNNIPLAGRSVVRNADEGRYAAATLFGQWSPGKTKGVILIGGSGLGKTVAGHRAVMYMIRHHQRGALYVSTRHVASDCLLLATDNAEKVKAEDRLTRVSSACRGDAIVFLDDLGRERLSDATTQRIAEYIDFLHERRAPAVFTSNFTGKFLGERYGTDVMSRLMDQSWLTVVKVDGHDKRIKPEAEPEAEPEQETHFQTMDEMFKPGWRDRESQDGARDA